MRSFDMNESLDIPNQESTSKVWFYLGARKCVGAQNEYVDTNRPDWFLKEWLSHYDKRQASLVNDLGWNKQKASFLWHGKQPYNRDIVNEISEWLGIHPYELLMPPSKALQLRAFEESAIKIAAEAINKPFG